MCRLVPVTFASCVRKIRHGLPTWAVATFWSQIQKQLLVRIEAIKWPVVTVCLPQLRMRVPS